MDYVTEKTSEDGLLLLRMNGNGNEADICMTMDGEEPVPVGAVDLRGEAINLAISNNGRRIAAVLEGINRYLYIYRHNPNTKGTPWDIESIHTERNPVKDLKWGETDPRYMPVELTVEYENGTTKTHAVY